MVPKVKNLTSIRSAPGRVFCLLVLCLPWLFSTVSADKNVPSFSDQQQNAQETRPEQEGKLIKLAAGDTFSQEIRVDSPQYLNLTAVRYGIDLTITVLSPDGSVLVSRQSRGAMYGPIRTYWVGRQGQVYFLRITSSNKEAVPRGFTLSIDKRPIDGQEPIRLSAQQAQLLGETKWAKGEAAIATRHFERAGKLWRTVNDPIEQGLSLYRLGDTLSFLGEPQRSREALQEALTLFRLASARFEEARTLISIGSLDNELGQTGLALESLNLALDLSKTVGDGQAEAMTLQNLGAVYERLGDRQSALSLLQQSLSIGKEINDRQTVGPVLLEIAQVYSSLGQHEMALSFLRKARDEARSNSMVELPALILTAENYQSLGNRAEARDFLSAALHKASSLGNNRLKALTMHRLGTVYADLGEPTRALEYYSKALITARKSGNPRQESRILNSLGLLYYSESRGDFGESAFRSALAIAKTAEDFAYQPTILYSLAKVKRKQGELVRSMRLIEQSLTLIELQRYNIVSSDLRSSYFASVRSHYEFYIDLLMELHKQQPENDFDSIAFFATERAHGQSLLELLSEAGLDRKHIDPNLLNREQELRTLLSAKISDQLRTLENQSDSRESFAADVRQLMTEYEEIQVQIKLQTPGYKTFMQGRTLNLKEIQDQLQDENTLLLEYLLGDERSYVFAVTRNSFNSYELPGRARIDQLARTVHELLIAPAVMPDDTPSSYEQRVSSSQARYWKEALALSQTLLGPVMKQMDAKRLLIVSDGSLQYIPFGALPVPTAIQQPLILEHEIVSLPSASILMKLRQVAPVRRHAAGSVAILADPVFEADDPRISPHEPTRDTQRRSSFRRLYGSKLEAEQILAIAPEASKMVVGLDANRNAVINGSLKDYQIVHFATHGVIDADPALSSIVLSLFDAHGKAQNGILLSRDIANLDLTADLVVLSACETGSGEGITDMTSSFLYAGAQSVVTSLWAVADTATADLMSRFYEGMWSKGMTPAEALRQAQIEMLQEPRWNHPYFWAAFTLQGNGDISIRANHKVSIPLDVDSLDMSSNAMAMVGVGLIGVVSIMIRRLRRIPRS